MLQPIPATADIVPDPDIAPARPRRLSAAPPARAFAGAAVAVAGVLLVIGALLWARSGPGAGTPTVAVPTLAAVQSAGVAPAAGAADSPTAAATDAPAPADASPPVESSALPSFSPAEVRALAARNPVLVLNSSAKYRLADRAAHRFRTAGWPVWGTGNIKATFAMTTIYYGPGQLRAAQAFATRFAGFPRVLPRFAALPGHGLTAVLTAGYSA